MKYSGLKIFDLSPLSLLWKGFGRDEIDYLMLNPIDKTSRLFEALYRENGSCRASVKKCTRDMAKNAGNPDLMVSDGS